MATTNSFIGTNRGERVFSAVTRGASITLVAVLGLVAGFLLLRSLPAFLAGPSEASLLPTNFAAYVAPLLFGTLWVAALALLFALPLAVGIALYLTHYAPARLAAPFAYLIDLLAAVPSVLFGLWGITVFAPALQPIYVWLNAHFGWIPLFGGTVSGTGRTLLTAALVLAVMILPIITALCREVFRQVPVALQEAAFGLGATKWEMVRLAILPSSKRGIVSAAMLGLGRALGETMAVAMVLSATGLVSFELFTSQNPSTIAANIALAFPEAFGPNVNVLIATGLVLFAATFLVNALARRVLGAGANKGGFQ